MSPRRSRIAAALGAALSLAAAAPAAADSIVYAKGGNVWQANSDGSDQRQVTRDGTPDAPYTSPSQADDGTIVASRFDEIVRMGRDGTVLNRIDPPGSQGTIWLDGKPLGTAISPDGKLVAFYYAQMACPVGTTCGVRRATLYTHADRFTPLAEFGSQRGVSSPSWIGNGRTLLFGGANMQVNVDDVGGGDESFVHWFDEETAGDIANGELARQGDRLVALRGFGDDMRVAVYRVTGSLNGGPPPAPPAPVCETPPSSEYDDPTWSPDGTAIAYARPGGIEISTLPSFASDTPCAGSIDRLVIPGGSEPDWGPAPVSGGAPTAPPRPAPSPSPSPLKLKLRLPARVSRRAALRDGIPVRVTVPAAGRIVATASAGSRRLGNGTATPRAAGTVTVRVRIARRHARRLGRAKRLAVEATFSGALGQASQLSLARLVR